MLENYCRLCGHVKHSMIQIFNGTENKSSLSNRIRTNLHIPITEDDLLPNTACNLCVETLDGFCQYMRSCHNAQVQLRKLLLTAGTRQMGLSKEEASSFQERNNSSTARHLFVQLPKLPLDYCSTKSVFKKETVEAEKNQFNLVATRISCSINTVQIKDEKDETLFSNINGDATIVPKELLQTSTIDVPLESTPTMFSSGSINCGDRQNLNADECISINDVTNMASHASIPEDIIRNLNLNREALQKLGQEVLSNNFPQLVHHTHNISKLPDVSRTIYDTHRLECNSDEIKNEPVVRIDGSEIVHLANVIGEPTFGDQQVSSSRVGMDSRSGHDVDVSKFTLNPILTVLKDTKYHLLSSSEASSISSTQNSGLYQRLTSKIDDASLANPQVEQNLELPSFKMNAFNWKIPHVILDPIDLKMKIRTSDSKISLENSLKCQFCAIQFTQRRTLRKHLWSAHRVEQCSKCSFITDHHKTLADHHREVHNSSRILVCKICNEHIAKKSLLKSHLKLQHPNTGNSDSSPPEKFPCKKCNMTFSFQSKLDFHFKLKHEEAIKLSCPSCPYVTWHRYRLTQHIKEVHEKRFVCDKCGKRLGKKSKMITHLQIFHSDRTPAFKCSLCDETFSQRYPYEEHLKVHSSDAQWICKHCTCKFDQKHKLLIHISKAHQDKSVKCRLCSYVTSHKYQLTQHVREVHEKRFVCEACGKLESKKSRLLTHIRNKHTEKKVYQCNICETKYSSKAWYKAHVKNHP